VVREEQGEGHRLLVQVKKQVREFGVWEKKNRSGGGGC